jgi:DNA mismatch repair protein MutS2
MTMSTHSPSTDAPQTLRVRSLESLDWPLVIAALAERASTIVGRERCEALPFFNHPVAAKEALADLAEMLELHDEQSSPPLGGIGDLRVLLTAAVKGDILDGPSLLTVSNTLEGLERLHGHLARDPEIAPRLWAVVRDIRPMPDLAHRLRASFDSRGELSASTYPQLSSLRSKKARLHARIQTTLTSLRTEERFTNALQDDFLALRNDRYVVPVRSAHKRAGLGIVHDTSGSGQTVFIEPYEVIEANNELKMADAELAREERRILRSLTETVGFAAPVLRIALDAATHIDLVQAKALLALDLNATVPAVDSTPGFHLIEARHPVLVLRGLDVVANNLTLGGETRSLILSGPNTGGKTVTLKTLGLAALLVRAGLAVPAAEGSRVGWFDLVLTDIGDSQDVEGDLSTFSGHVLNLVEILRTLDAAPKAKGLVLLDEIAAGTDPVQGAGFGRAMLEGMLERGVLLATTTHYPELKALSGADPRFVNARVEFDGDENRPTYRVTVGQAGSSHALDVAAALGVEPAILTRARSYLGDAAMHVEDMLSSVESQLLTAERARKKAEAAAEEAEGERAAAELVRRELDKERRHVERTVRSEFQREVQGYREQVKTTIRQLRKEGSDAFAERARQQVREGAAAVLGTLAAGPEATPPVDWSGAKIGDPVRVVRLGKEGTIVVLPDARGKLFVEINGRRMQVKTADLAPGQRRPKPKPKPKAKFPNSKKKSKKKAKPTPASEEREELELDSAVRNPSNVVDLRGTTVDEALGKVDRFLDDASLSNEPFVFILHGLGTGALRNAVRLHLRRSMYVGTFAPGNRSQGGDGITVARIN